MYASHKITFMKPLLPNFAFEPVFLPQTAVFTSSTCVVNVE